MGLVSLIPKVFTYGRKAINYAWRGAKASPNIIFGNGAEAFVNGAKGVTKASGESLLKTLWNGVKQGGKAAEGAAIANGNFFKAMIGEFKSFPAVIKRSVKWNVGRAMVKNGRTLGPIGKFWAGTKGVFKGLGKKMPLIGNLLLVAFELPNIVKATKEQGIGAGIKETLKAGVRLTAASIASVALAGVLPPFGAIAGFMIGDWLASKVVGKSYSEKKAEAEAQVQEQFAQLPQQPVYQPSMQPAMRPTFNGNSNPFGDHTTSMYDNDIMKSGRNFNIYA